MQIKRQIFLIMNRKCYLCIENKKRTPNSALITKSYDKSVWCNFSVHCLNFITSQKHLVPSTNHELSRLAPRHHDRSHDRRLHKRCTSRRISLPARHLSDSREAHIPSSLQYRAHRLPYTISHRRTIRIYLGKHDNHVSSRQTPYTSPSLPTLQNEYAPLRSVRR